MYKSVLALDIRKQAWERESLSLRTPPFSVLGKVNREVSIGGQKIARVERKLMEQL